MAEVYSIPTNPKFIDLTGQQFGRLTVIKFAGITKRLTRWLCKCSCGEERIVPTNALRSGNSRSCGCLSVDTSRAKAFRHGMKSTAEYTCWVNMIGRCHNPKKTRFADYGGRGIMVCERWRNDFLNFYDDMGPRPSNKHQIDRINNDGNYEPSNCRWVTNKQNARNTRRNHLISYRGQTKTLSEWVEITGFPLGTIKKRLAAGRDGDDLFAPSRNWRKKKPQ